jgi:thiol-disulfide isomerase/thioredoxin
MRAPVDHIAAPPFPHGLPWINSGPLRLERLLGRPLLVEFWDFCRPNSIRTLPYIKAWRERYEDAGLRVIGVHTAGFEPSADPDAVRRAVERLGIVHPVVVDVEREIWRAYGNLGWPARYLFDPGMMLAHYHYGEGAYDETERAIQELCGVERDPVEPLRPEDVPGAILSPQSEDVDGFYSGPYEAGGVWAVLDGRGTATVNGRVVAVDGPGCYELLSHERSTAGELRLELSDGVRCHAVCFTPGVESSAGHPHPRS